MFNGFSTTILVAIFVVFLIIAGPFITIWSLNTLFPVLAIPYTIETWIAALCIGGLFKTTVTRKG